MDDPYHDIKPVHLAKLVAPDGAVSPWCAVQPRRLNLHLSKWTTDQRAVTCRRCLVAANRPARAEGVPPTSAPDREPPQ